MGLPNYFFEPRKPFSLGTNIRNRVECASGRIAFQDEVMSLDYQHTNNCEDEPSILSDYSPTKTHEKETLSQFQVTGVVEGGWVGINSCFGGAY